MKIENVCFSGGAAGADILFGTYAAKAGHKVIHYSFAAHARKKFGVAKDPLPVRILTPEDLYLADPYLKEANKILKRTFPTQSEFTNNLLRRNFWQIKDTKRVYAISSIDENNRVRGGTAWAVHMAILRKVPDIYVFDQNENAWFLWFPDHSKWMEVHQVPKPKGKYTGIGSRPENLKECGIKAIGALYA